MYWPFTYREIQKMKEANADKVAKNKRDAEAAVSLLFIVS